MPGDQPILVDSAGCGAALKDYGHLLGTPDAARFAARVFDIHEWLAAHTERLATPDARHTRHRVALQDRP
jgi:glycolate oxidase iron-sulfur subunit